jgi:aminoglycoside 6'-N-acetyltransferase
MRVELHPLVVAHVKRLRELHRQPGVERWWGPMDPEFPFDEPESTRFAIVADGEVVGLVQFGEEDWDDARHAYVDIFVGDEHAGRGIGSEALRQTIEILVKERGHHRITIDPDPENEAAVRSYEKSGFARVGTLKRAYRDERSGEWTDALLMELVFPPAPAPPSR